MKWQHYRFGCICKLNNDVEVCGVVCSLSIQLQIIIAIELYISQLPGLTIHFIHFSTQVDYIKLILCVS